MNGLVKTVKHIQVKQISYCPKIFEALITYEPHPTEYDESDDLEYQKKLMNNLVRYNWFQISHETRVLLDNNSENVNIK